MNILVFGKVGNIEVDPKFSEVFFQTYGTFCSPQQLLHSLSLWFGAFCVSFLSIHGVCRYSSTASQPQLNWNVTGVFTSWLGNHERDLLKNQEFLRTSDSLGLMDLVVSIMSSDIQFQVQQRKEKERNI